MSATQNHISIYTRYIPLILHVSYMVILLATLHSYKRPGEATLKMWINKSHERSNNNKETSARAFIKERMQIYLD